jgi:hypothetical protein
MVLFLFITCPLKGLCTVLHTTSVQQRTRGLGLAPFVISNRFQATFSYWAIVAWQQLSSKVVSN